MSISPDWVRAMLVLWGRWAAGGGTRGLPTVTAFYRPCVPSGGSGNAPPEIEDLDHLICIAYPEDRHVLIVHYSTKGARDDKARSMGISLRQYLRRLKRAEKWIGEMMDQAPPIYRQQVG